MNAITALLGAVLFYGLLEGAGPGAQDPREEPALARSGVVTLYRYDDVRASFGFTTGDYGRVVEDGEIKNRNSEVCLWGDPAREDQLAFGVQGGDRAAVVDLGDPRDEATRSTSYYRIDREQAREALAGAKAEGMATAPIALGHVLVVRLDRAAGGGLEQTFFVRLRVVDHAPGRNVTLRWDIL